MNDTLLIKNFEQDEQRVNKIYFDIMMVERSI